MKEFNSTLFVNKDINFFLQKLKQEKETSLVIINNGNVQYFLRFNNGDPYKISWIDKTIYKKLIKNILTYQDDKIINYFVYI